jgi:hypothetical protein
MRPLVLHAQSALGIVPPNYCEHWTGKSSLGRTDYEARIEPGGQVVRLVRSSDSKEYFVPKELFILFAKQYVAERVVETL